MLRPMRTTVKPRVKRTLTITLTLASGALVCSGCAYGELKQVLRAQVAAETSCGDVTIESSPAYQPGYKPGQYRVQGCGVDRTYDCPKEDGLVSYSDTNLCKYVDTKAIKPPGATPATEPMMDELPELPMDDAAESPADAMDAPMN